jgi:hypothetical protein
MRFVLAFVLKNMNPTPRVVGFLYLEKPEFRSNRSFIKNSLPTENKAPVETVG